MWITIRQPVWTTAVPPRCDVVRLHDRVDVGIRHIGRSHEVEYSIRHCVVVDVGWRRL